MPDIAAQADALVAGQRYLTLATANADGAPWATPVWFAALGCAEFFWVSRPQARHSRNVAVRPAVGIVVFDTGAVPYEGEGVYVEAEAAEVAAGDLARALAVYDERSREQGLPGWSRERVLAPSAFRLYRAVARQVYLLDDGDRRIPVPAAGSAGGTGRSLPG